MNDIKPYSSGKRILQKIFPPLEVCREEFEQRVKIDAETLWGDKGDTDAVGPNDPTTPLM